MTTTTPVWTVGDRLRKAREASGLDVAGMAGYLGVSRNTVTNYEHDRVRVTRATLVAYATATHVPVWWLEGAEPPDQVSRVTPGYRRGGDGHRSQGLRSAA